MKRMKRCSTLLQTLPHTFFGALALVTRRKLLHQIPRLDRCDPAHKHAFSIDLVNNKTPTPAI
jgi:hypothetical protein